MRYDSRAAIFEAGVLKGQEMGRSMCLRVWEGRGSVGGRRAKVASGERTEGRYASED